VRLAAVVDGAEDELGGDHPAVGAPQAALDMPLGLPEQGAPTAG
jgi:hypothetical protein